MPFPILGALAAAAPIIGGALDFIGGNKANAANAKQAQSNRDFQQSMSGTSYQRAVADMKAAGLNPALAYQQGGASTPSGATAQMTNTLAGSGNNARAAATTYQEVQNLAAQREATRAQTAKTSAEANQITIESAARLAELKARAKATATNAEWLDKTFADRHYGLQQDNFAKERENKFGDQAFGLRLAQLRALINATVSNARESNSRATLNELRRAEEHNKAARQGDWWKRIITPYLNDARAITGMADDIIPF